MNTKTEVGGTTISVMSNNAFRSLLAELVPRFEHASGHKVSISWSTTAQTIRRVLEGETADVVIVTIAGFEEMEKLGQVLADSRADLCSSGIGICVRTGSPKPDISSVEAFTRSLLDAKSIAYTTLGMSGVHFERIVTRLGIMDQLKPRFKVIPGGLIGELVVRGDAEVGVQMISEILAVEGCELVGPFPPELQQITRFAAGILKGSKHAGNAKALIDFMKTPEAMTVMATKGLQNP